MCMNQTKSVGSRGHLFVANIMRYNHAVTIEHTIASKTKLKFFFRWRGQCLEWRIRLGHSENAYHCRCLHFVTLENTFRLCTICNENIAFFSKASFTTQCHTSIGGVHLFIARSDDKVLRTNV